MRREPEHFDEQELPLLYIAKKLDEAVRLEEVLTAAGVDYLVEPDKYSGGVIFRSERVGAFFYVSSADEESARKTLVEARYIPYEAAPEG